MTDEFWKPHENLHKQIKQRMREFRVINPLALLSVDKFFELESAKSWSPKQVLKGELSYVIDIGLPLTILQDDCDPLPDKYLKGLNDFVRRNKQIMIDGASKRKEKDKDFVRLWSEVEVATIFKSFGASIEFTRTIEGQKTADLRICWQGAHPTDVEVTAPDEKESHRTVQNAIKKFIDTLRPGDLDSHILCLVEDAFNQALLAEAFDAACELKPNQFAESPGKWFVKAIPLEERDSIVSGQAETLSKPEWWPDDQSHYFGIETVYDGQENPVVMLKSLIPQAPYMNSLCNKANRPQHTERVPFIIALDVSNLPDAFNRMRGEIFENFEIWKYVSGVMLYIPTFFTGIERKSYHFTLLQNPHASYPIDPMPESLLEYTRGEIKELRLI